MHSPGSNDPWWYAENKQDCAWADSHQSLHDKACVKVDLIEGSDTAWRGVRKELTVQEHDTANQIQPQEHGDGEDDVHICFCHRRGVGEGQAGGPSEDVLTWNGVDGTHQQLQNNEQDTLVRHGYPPVVCSIVNHKELNVKQKQQIWRHWRVLQDHYDLHCKKCNLSLKNANIFNLPERIVWELILDILHIYII